MAASFPGSIKSFTTKVDVTDVVAAADMDDVQLEVAAIETILGTNTHVSTARSTTYASVKARLEALETDYSLGSHAHAHSALTGLTAGDDHTQYMLASGSRHDLTGRHTFGAALGTPAAASTSALGDAAAAGTAAGPARADHVHGREALGGAPPAVQAGGSAAAGTATTPAHSDHTHALAAAVPAGSAVGDAQSAGASTSVARADHVHAREAFGAVTAATSFGQSAANGSAATVAHSDHTHGSPTVGGGNPAASAPGDAAAEGGSGAAARLDHKHAREAYAAVVSAMTTYGVTPAVGVSIKVAREDHNHGTPDPTLTGPTGVVAMYAASAPPPGWLMCDGSAINRTTYAALFAVIGTKYGVGNGTTTFNIPNFIGYVPVGDSLAGVIAQGGAGFHNHTGSTAAVSHTHTGSSGAGSAHDHAISAPGGTGMGTSHGHGATAGNETAQHQHHVSAPFDATGEYTDLSDGSQPHQHGITVGAESSHSHPIDAVTAGAEAAHTHPVTVNAEASHTHGVTVNANTVLNTVTIAFIIKT